MTTTLIETILSEDEGIRNCSINFLLQGKNKDDLLIIADDTEAFRRHSNNLYHKVRASLYLFVIYRFFLMPHENIEQHGTIPLAGVRASLERNFAQSIDIYLEEIKKNNLNSALFSALAESYYKISFQYLLQQVKRSISHCTENFLLFNINSLADYPYSVLPELSSADKKTGLSPILLDTSPVRLDPSHSGWSDIFFLGMDFPEGARVINLSVNLKIHGSDARIKPPCECYCRFIEEPVIQLTSIDLKASKKISHLEELFNFGSDHLSLLKAGVVASGIIPPCLENKDLPLHDILQKLLNKPGGIEVVTRVNNIPKGSRLAVSTALLTTVITCLMRFSGQIVNLTGPLKDDERRVVASRAILGEWLGGSGGGWQDSGGLWPGIKVITGKTAEKGNPEFGVSKGCLLPEHNLLSEEIISKEVEDKIVNSIVLVHGGISQDVGPILEMVTEKYLLRYEKEWSARKKGIRLFDKIVDALKAGDMKELGRLTTKDWEESIQQIIPGVNNAFTQDLIAKVKNEFNENYWGFLMLGGMSGGGMAFIINPEIKKTFKNRVAAIMRELKELYEFSLPFIIDPAVYDFKLNHDGIVAQLLTGKNAQLPLIHQIFNNKKTSIESLYKETDEEDIKKKYGFDVPSHEHMKSLLKHGKIGLAKNRLPRETRIQDVHEEDIFHFEKEKGDGVFYNTGADALRRNEIAVVSFAGGMGTRWSQGSAVVKPINPFVWIEGKHRTFLELHLAKSKMTGKTYGCRVPHIFTTSYLTHDAIDNYLKRFNYFDYEEQVYLSPAKTIGHRVYPMERDLRFLWEEQLHQKLDENTQKVIDDIHESLIEWAKSRGQGDDYSENKYILRFNPPGHWYEVPNLIKNGVLAKVIMKNPNLKYLLCHNIDTVGAHIEPSLLGMHINEQSCLTFEVIPKWTEDKGGGLATINRHLQIVEGLALPKEEDEYTLSYYNTLTNWITIDSLLEFLGLDRELIIEAESRPDLKHNIIEGIRRVENKMPTYVTIKNVKYLWGAGQEDVYPVAQFEKLWGDMTVLKELKVSYASVSRYRGQQLKEPSQLDRWLIDGSFEYIKDKTFF
jgi:UDP-N-acetylglucosamine pyrophosphorylase/galactokinase/mevalonate kinase-like predicted kinase